MWNHELQIAKELAVKAGSAIMEIYAKSDEIQVEYKEGNMPLTLADKKANEIIVQGLRRVYPQYAILSEEEKDNPSRLKKEYCFVVDPLDGTKEFIKRNGQFTVNIALAYKQKSVMGVIYAPVTGELYYASQGDGAYLEKSGERSKIRVSNRRGELRAVMSSSHGCQQMDELIEKHGIKNFVKMGSSLKGCLVARGDADIYFRYNPTMEWDTAAMQCIVEEAGGIFRQMDDEEMVYNRENPLNAKGFYAINTEYNRLR